MVGTQDHERLPLFFIIAFILLVSSIVNPYHIAPLSFPVEYMLNLQKEYRFLIIFPVLIFDLLLFKAPLPQFIYRNDKLSYIFEFSSISFTSSKFYGVTSREEIYEYQKTVNFALYFLNFAFLITFFRAVNSKSLGLLLILHTSIYLLRLYNLENMVITEIVKHLLMLLFPVIFVYTHYWPSLSISLFTICFSVFVCVRIEEYGQNKNIPPIVFFGDATYVLTCCSFIFKGFPQ